MKGENGRRVDVIYCDDIRMEVGEKMSLMGIYQGELILGTLPAKLPKICALVKVTTSINKPFKYLKIRLFQGENVLSNFSVPNEVFQDQEHIISDPSFEDEDTSDHEILFQIAFTAAPLVVEESCELVVRATTEEGEIKGNRLKIKCVADIH